MGVNACAPRHIQVPYLKGGSERAASHLHNYVRYMATREAPSTWR